MLMNIVVWLIVGALAGWIGSMIMKTDAQMGALASIVVGIIGAFIGGWVLSRLGVQVVEGQLSVPSILSAILGAVILLGVLKMMSGRRAV